MGQKERFYVDVMSMHPEVTGSCNLIVVKFPDGETLRFVVDCGLFQENGYETKHHSQTIPNQPSNLPDKKT